MNELEQKLGALPLAVPSADLDRRMVETFMAVRRIRKRSSKAAFWWWVAAFSVAGGVAASLVVSLIPSHPEPDPIIYRLEPQGRMLDLLVGSPRDGHQPFVLRANAPQFEIRSH